MKTEIEEATKRLLKQIDEGVDAPAAMQLSQAVLNLAHARNVLNNTKG